MIKRIHPFIFFIFCSFYFFLFNSLSFAQSTSNICTQTQCVKIQNGSLWVLSSDNVTYQPYFIKAVGYEPIPIGRYPSDWGYPSTDPRSVNNNMYDDPNILNRDFSLLQQMNANTIRIWNGVDSKIGCQCTNNGRFPNYITNAATTANANTTQNTLDIANSYGLKVIAGFWVNYLSFDANNNVSSTDNQGNPINSQQIINNFVNYVNTFKGNRAILFWAIGNENNYETLNGGAVPITAFENAFGASYGDSIFNWLQETENFLDYDGDIIVDFNSGAVQGAIMQQYPSDYNTIMNVLQPYRGQTLNAQQLAAWYALVDAMAKAAHNAEGASFHPVAVVNGEIATIGNSADGSTDSQMPDLDIWGSNVYRGKSFGTLFSDYASRSGKPLWISEFGVDSWNVTNATDINNWGLTLSTDLGGTGAYDPADQSTWDSDLWNEILNNSPVTIGGSLMEYSDEWWKPYEFYCTSPNSPNNATSSSVCNSNQKHFGFPFSPSPDGFSNEEWYGVMAISPNPVAGGPDIMTPRTVYNTLQAQWTANPWPTVTLDINGSGTGNISSSASLGGAGLNCNFASGSSTGSCSAAFGKNQSVTLTFSSNNNSTVTNWGTSGCAAGSSTCILTPSTGTVLNVTITAPSSALTVNLTSPANNASFTAPASITLSASASEASGTISSVSFYNGTTLLGTSTSSPYTYTWTNVAAGTYSLTAVATDGTGQTATSAAVSVTVSNVQQCLTNMYYNTQTNTCTCIQYTYWTGNGCSYCPEGQASYNGTTCVPIQCPANMYYDTNPSDSGYNTCVCVAGTVYTTGPGCVPITYTITATAGSNGTISPASAAVPYGGSQTFTLTPNTGYTASLTVDGTLVTLSNNTYTLSNVTAAHNLVATFTQNNQNNTYVITATATNGGTISPSGTVTVNSGANQTFVVNPDVGYTVQVTLDGTLVALANNTYTLKNITAAHTLAATFTQITYLVTATAGSNGSISPMSVQVPYNSSQTFTVTPNAGYTGHLTVDGASVQLLYNNTYTLGYVTAPHTLAATFTQNTYTVTATTSGNGTISPASVTVPYGGSQTFTLTPNTGYTASLTEDGASVALSNNTYTLSNVTAAHNLVATFTQNNQNNTYVITATAGSNGSISPSGTTTVNSGGSQTYTITPNSGYMIASILVDGTALTGTLQTSYMFSNVTANQTISATFSPIQVTTYTITATAGSNGSISPASATVPYGGSQTFTLTPNTGYTASLTVDGTLVTLSNNTYTLSNVTAAHNLVATFTQNNQNNTYVITATAGGNGIVFPPGVTTVNAGGFLNYMITPNNGYKIASISIDGTKLTGTLTTSYTFSNVTANQTISATFAPVTSYTIIATAGRNGRISPSGSVSVRPGASQTFKITPNSGYRIASVLINGTPLTGVLSTSFTFTDVIFNETISVTFTSLKN